MEFKNKFIRKLRNKKYIFKLNKPISLMFGFSYIFSKIHNKPSLFLCFFVNTNQNCIYCSIDFPNRESLPAHPSFISSPTFIEIEKGNNEYKNLIKNQQEIFKYLEKYIERLFKKAKFVNFIEKINVKGGHL